MPYYLLEPTTAAAQSSEIVCNHKILPVQISAPNLAGDETVTIQKRSADGNYHDYTVASTLQQISATNACVVLDAPGVYRGNKTATVAEVGVEISTDITP